ncbi:MAG: CoA transferase [Proteobacteria bacterium]|nr:CoA transferase [Pseudomonadota bacterium]
MSGPLSGLRVFDLTRILAGPSCTQILGDLGADVVKIELPGSGDDTRSWPPYLRDDQGSDTSETAYFACANRNKRSLTLNLRSGEGQALARRLIATCDILVENFKTGSLKKYGLDYDQLKDDFPKLIYCSISGFGRTGPYASRPGYDVMIQAMGGLMSVTGHPGAEPQKTGVPVSDLFAGMYAALSINAALRHREISGEGQLIDIGLLDTTVAMMSNQAMNYLATGLVPPRLGNEHPNIAPYQVFPTSDGGIVIACGNDNQFRRLCEFLQCPQLADDAKFKSNALRLQNRQALNGILYPLTARQTSAHLLENLEKLSIACGPINTLDKVFSDPQVIARGMLVELDHPAPGEEKLRLVGSPINMSRTPVGYRYPPPRLGQHSDELLTEILGMDSEEIASLRECGAI